jgi:hypothetical protein
LSARRLRLEQWLAAEDRPLAAAERLPVVTASASRFRKSSS